jgi:hypothetical protein
MAVGRIEGTIGKMKDVLIRNIYKSKLWKELSEI